jgi:broad specificity phosphatase PhoE
VTRLYLVRHGETDSNVEGRTQGARDVPLNDLGRRQAEALAAKLSTSGLAAIYASTASRALDTAAPIAAVHGLEIQGDERFAELDQGELDGLTGEDLRHEHADFLHRWRTEDPATLRMPGGETLGEVQERMIEASREAIAATRAAAGDESALAIVSHNLALRALLCHILDVPLASFRRFHHDVAAIAEVEAPADADWFVLGLNEHCEMPREA